MILLAWFAARWRIAVNRRRRVIAVAESAEHRRRTAFNRMVDEGPYGDYLAVSWWGPGDR